MENELVSIVTPVYNGEKFIKETIETIRNQTYTNWECLIINDCSTDKTIDVIKKYINCDERIKLINLDKNAGSATARNIGINQARGRFLCFQDADDLWDKEKLEKQVNFMQKNKCAFSYTSYEFVNEFGKPSGKKVLAREKIVYKEALKNTIISTITVMFDLKRIEKELIKMPNLKYVEDTATWWKILRNGYTAYGIEDVFSYYRRFSKSQSSNKIKTLGRLWNLYRKEEKLNIFYASYCFFWKNINAVLRRI